MKENSIAVKNCSFVYELNSLKLLLKLKLITKEEYEKILKVVLEDYGNKYYV